MEITRERGKAALVNLQYPATSEQAKAHVSSPTQTTFSQEERDELEGKIPSDSTFKDESHLLHEMGLDETFDD